MDAIMEVVKSLGFDDMTGEYTKELLLEEEIDEAGFVESQASMISHDT